MPRSTAAAARAGRESCSSTETWRSPVTSSFTASVLALMVGMAAPAVAKDISPSRVNRAARVVAGDLEQALTLAGRQRRPVRVVFDGSAKEIRLVDRVSGNLISRRQLGDVSDYKLY